MSFSTPAILMFCCPDQYINEEQQTIKKGPQAIKKDVTTNVAKETAWKPSVLFLSK